MRAVFQAALLLACCVWVIQAQTSIANQENSIQSNLNANESTNNQPTVKQQEPQPRSNVWGDPIRFSTKAKDSCALVITGQKDLTKLRVNCKNKGKSYWCEFLGKPNVCRAYNNNPRHYFSQIMWELRKLQNACQGSQFYKPQMCRAASDEAQMVLQASWPKTPRHSQPQPTKATSKPPATTKATSKPTTSTKSTSKPLATTTKSTSKPPQPTKSAKPGTKATQPRKTIKTTTARPTAEAENQSTKLAEDYCWSGMQGICAYVISWFN